MKIIDSFIFYNELDILEIHLEEVYDHVDHIIIVEATETFAGNSKSSFYLDNSNRFEKYKDKIIHLITDFKENFFTKEQLDSKTDKWFREDYQRECIYFALKKLDLTDDDIFILADVDEIPNSQILRSIKQNEIVLENNVFTLEMDLYYYSTEFTVARKWTHPKIAKMCVLKYFPLLKYFRHYWKSGIIHNAGWHLSYFGDASFIKNKIDNYSEEMTEEDKKIENISDCLNNHILPFNKEKLIHIKGINLNLPKFFRRLSN
jgi:beta-1,4-mannosyl-glycoprotein beta-1,4-N-acetylglucosaminyltransferase